MCRGPGTYPFHDPPAAGGLRYATPQLVVYWTAKRSRINLQQTSAYRILGTARLQAGVVQRSYPCRISHPAPLPRPSAKMREWTNRRRVRSSMSATSRQTRRLDECLLDNATLLPACRKPLLTPAAYPDTAISSGGGRMEYQGFVVDAFERGPGKWRAKLSRSSGRPLITGRKRIWQFVTGIDTTTAPAALLMALEAIDAGTFSRAAPIPEKFWRRRGRCSNAPTSDGRSIRPAQLVNQNCIERARFGRSSTVEQSEK